MWALVCTMGSGWRPTNSSKSGSTSLWHHHKHLTRLDRADRNIKTRSLLDHMHKPTGVWSVANLTCHFNHVIPAVWTTSLNPLPVLLISRHLPCHATFWAWPELLVVFFETSIPSDQLPTSLKLPGRWWWSSMGGGGGYHLYVVNYLLHACASHVSTYASVTIIRSIISNQPGSPFISCFHSHHPTYHPTLACATAAQVISWRGAVAHKTSALWWGHVDM